MLKASRALLRVATILGTVCGALILACVPALLVIGVSPTIHDMLVNAVNDGSIKVHSNVELTAQQIVLGLQIVFVSTAVVLLIIGVMCVVNAIIASKTREEPTRGRYIACIVTGALSTDFSIVAAIFGLICLSKQEQTKKLEE